MDYRLGADVAAGAWSILDHEWLPDGHAIFGAYVPG
jgi:hypothetical protein